MLLKGFAPKLLTVIILIASLGPFLLKDKISQNRDPAAYFQGSIFRKAEPKEGEKAVQVLSCSGNLLKSSDGNLYVMTAGHCLKFIDSCYDINIRVHMQEQDKNIFIDGKCREMKINDKEHDIVIFKAELFKDNVRFDPSEDLKYCLEDNVLLPGASAKIVHFPSFDPDKTGTTNVVKASKPSEISTRTPRVSEKCSIISEPVWCSECRDKQIVQWTNCPLFEGSSGSGLIGTKNSCIAGVAHAADSGSKEYGSTEKGASVAVVPLFVKKYRKQLDELKIKIGNVDSKTEPADIISKEFLNRSVR